VERLFLRNISSLELKLHTSAFIIGLGLSAPAYFIPIFLQELGASYTLIGIMGSIRSTPYALLPIFTGFIMSRYDMRKLYVLSSILSLIGFTLLSISQSYLEIGLANFLLGVSMVFYWPIAESIIAEFFPEDLRWKVYSSFSASWSTAYFIGPIVGGVLAELANLRTLFSISGIICGVAAPLIYLMGELRLKNIDRIGFKGGKLIHMWSLYVMVFLFTIGMACLILLAPSYFYEAGWSNLMVGTVFTVFGMTRTIAYVLLSKLKKIDEARIMTLSITIQSIAIFLLIYTRPEIIFPILALAGLINGAYFVASFSVISKKVQAGYRSISIGFLESIIGLGFIIGPAFTGLLLDYLNVWIAFTITSLVILSALPILFFSKNIR
jgi:MFS family permease